MINQVREWAILTCLEGEKFFLLLFWGFPYTGWQICIEIKNKNSLKWNKTFRFGPKDKYCILKGGGIKDCRLPWIRHCYCIVTLRIRIRTFLEFNVKHFIINVVFSNCINLNNYILGSCWVNAFDFLTVSKLNYFVIIKVVSVYFFKVWVAIWLKLLIQFER